MERIRETKVIVIGVKGRLCNRKPVIFTTDTEEFLKIYYLHGLSEGTFKREIKIYNHYGLAKDYNAYFIITDEICESAVYKTALDIYVKLFIEGYTINEALREINNRGGFKYLDAGYPGDIKKMLQDLIPSLKGVEDVDKISKIIQKYVGTL